MSTVPDRITSKSAIIQPESVFPAIICWLYHHKTDFIQLAMFELRSTQHAQPQDKVDGEWIDNAENKRRTHINISFADLACMAVDMAPSRMRLTGQRRNLEGGRSSDHGWVRCQSDL